MKTLSKTKNGIDFVLDAPMNSTLPVFVFGTRTNQWYCVDEFDRDYAHGIPQPVFETQSESASRAQYLSASLV